MSLAILSYACTTVYEKQSTCISQDWYSIGYDVAKHGDNAEPAWANATSGCAEQKMWADRESYDRGYALGLAAFCTRANGFEFGQRNLGYDYICADEQQAIFNAAYIDGKELYAVNLNVESSENDLLNEKDKIIDARLRRKELARVLKNSNLDKKTRKKYVKERYNLKQSLYGAKSHIAALEATLRESNRQQAKIEFTLFEKYYNDADTQATVISLDTSVSRDSITINQPAIIVYKPAQMTSEIKKHFKLTTKEINKSVSEIGNGQFRYQMVEGLTLKFLPSNSNAFSVNAGTEYTQPMLLLWNGEELQPEGYNYREVEELTAIVKQFIQEN